jgi:hypothetical protein
MSDWTTETADRIVRAVDMVRERTVDPAQAIARGTVYGILAALIALPALVMATIGLFRGLVIIYQGEVWAAWLTLGAIFVLFGLLLWSRRKLL